MINTHKHPLQRYLDETDESAGQFARRVCTQDDVIQDILSGQTMPDLCLARRIAAETGGCVDLHDLLSCTKKAAGSTDKNIDKHSDIIDFSAQKRRQAQTPQEQFHSQASVEYMMAALKEELTKAGIGADSVFLSEIVLSTTIEGALMACDAAHLARADLLQPAQQRAQLHQALRPAIAEILEASLARPPVASQVAAIAGRLAQRACP